MPPSAAMALRDSFGDRKVPDISRKITACVLCRKLKIKCHMSDNKAPCSRCKARGLTCTVNKSLQMLLENDVSWKEKMEGRMGQLEHALSQSTSQPSIVPSFSVSSSRPSQGPASLEAGRSSIAPPTSSVPSSNVTLNLSCSLGAFPASSMISLTLTDIGGYPGQVSDLVSCGLIPHKEAEDFFAFYKQNLNPCIHHILTESDTFPSIRARSPLLLAAICTVSALCTGSKHYAPVLKYLTTQVSGKVFSSRHTFDDVRALCIGALWLNEVSTALNSLAVRIATELDLHRCITKMPHTKRACYDRTRLYWLVYLCDHHSSLSHGRPPLTRDFQSLRKPRDFLQSYFTNPSDLTLISQVEMWSLSSKAFDMFGADIEWHVASQRGAELAQLSDSYERWSGEWLDMLSFSDASTTDNFSCRVFDLYFHSAKLYLYSHIFRGSSPEEDTRSKLSAESTTGVNRFVQGALTSALSIVRCIVDNTQPWPWLETLPVYLGTMIAFACVVLVKASRHQGVLSHNMLQNGVDIPGYLRRLVQVLRASPIVDSPTHPLLNIARSLEVATNGQQQQQQQEHSHQTNFAVSWDYIPDLEMDFGCFDLFMNEEALDSSDQRAVFTGS